MLRLKFSSSSSIPCTFTTNENRGHGSKLKLKSLGGSLHGTNPCVGNSIAGLGSGAVALVVRLGCDLRTPMVTALTVTGRFGAFQDDQVP